MSAVRAVRRALKRRGGASAVTYGLLVGMIAVAIMGTLIATGDRMDGNYSYIVCTMQRSLGLVSADTNCLPTAPVEVVDDSNPPEDAEPPEMALPSLRFTDRTVEPAQYTVSETVRVTGFSGSLAISVTSPDAGSDAQISVAGNAFASNATITPGQTLRVRLRAAADFAVARTARVVVGGTQVPTWTVTVRERDDTPDPVFVVRPSPWLYDYGSGAQVLVPPVDTDVAETRRSIAMFPSYTGGVADSFSRVPTLPVAAFDGELPLELSLSGAPAGTRVLAQRNGGEWTEPDGNGTALMLRAGDNFGLAVDVPPNNYDKTFRVHVAFGTTSTDWQIATRTYDTVPDPLVFANTENEPVGDGTRLQTSGVATVTGMEAPGTLALSEPRLPGSAMRICPPMGVCDPAAADGTTGWSVWGTGGGIVAGSHVQLRQVVPAFEDVQAVVALSAGDGSDAGSWTLATATDGPDPLAIPPSADRELNATVSTGSLVVRGTVTSLRLTVPAGSFLSSGYTNNVQSLSVAPGQSFRISTTAPGSYGTTKSVPLTVSGRMSNGQTATWSNDWTPPAVWTVTTRAADAVPNPLSIPPRDGAELSTMTPSQGVAAAGFDATLPISLAGPAGSEMLLNGPGVNTVLAAGAAPVQISAGTVIVVRVTSASDYQLPVSATVTLGSGDDATVATFTATTRAQRTAPVSLSVPPTADAVPGQLTASQSVLLDGFDSAIDIQATGAGSPQIRVGDPATWSDAAWTTGPVRASPGTYVQLRATAPDGYSTVRSIALQAGTANDDRSDLASVAVEGTWQLGTLSLTLDFPPVAEVDPSATVNSQAVLLSMLASGTTPASLSGDSSAVMVVNDVVVGRNASLVNGQKLQLRLTSAATFDTPSTVTLQIDDRQVPWTVTTRARRTVPAPALSLPPLTGLDPASGRHASQAVTVQGIDGTLPATASGELSPLVIANAAPAAAAADIAAGGSIGLEVDAPADYDASGTAQLQLGERSYDLRVSARSRRWCPADVAFSDLQNKAPGTQQVSDSVELGATDGTLPVAVTGTYPVQLSVDGGAWGSSGAVQTGSVLQLRMTTPSDTAAYGQAVVAFGPAAQCKIYWKLVPIPANAVPAAQQLVFADVDNADPDQDIVIAGGPSGSAPGPITLPAPVGIAVSANAQVRIGTTGVPSGSGTVQSGNAVYLLVKAPDTFATPKSVQVTFGSQNRVVTVTTRALRTVPAGLSFASSPAQEPATRLCSAPATLTGFEVPLTATASGPQGANVTLKVNDGEETGSAQVTAGAQLRLCANTASGFSTPTVASVTVGTTSASWTVTTRAQRSTPGDLGLVTLYSAPLSQEVHTAVTLSGFDGSLQASVASAGSGFDSHPRLSVNGASPVSGPVAVTAADTLELYMTTQANIDLWSSASLQVGTRAGQWDAYTGADNVPDAFDFKDPTVPYAPSTAVTSNTVTLTGFTVTLPVTLSGDPSATLVLDGTDTGQKTASVHAGQTLAIRTATPAAYNSVQVSTVTVGPHASDTWRIATRGEDSLPSTVTFTALTGQELNRQLVSNTVTMKAFDGAQRIAVTATPAGAVAEFSMDGGTTWMQEGSIQAGTTVKLRMSTAGAYSTTRTATLTVGTGSAAWSLGTRAIDTNPDALGLATVYKVATGTRISTPVVLSGFDGNMQASVVNADTAGYDPQPRFSLNGGAETAGPVTVKAGDTLVLSHRTAPDIDTWSKSLVTLSLNGSSVRQGTWQTYTGPDNLPDQFDFNTPSGLVTVNTTYTSNTVTLGGFEGTLTATVSGISGITWVKNGTVANSDNVQVKAGDSLRLRATTGATYNTAMVATVFVGPYVSDTWTLNVRGFDNTPNNFTVPALTGRDPSVTVVSGSFGISSFDGPQYLSVTPAVRNAAYATDILTAEYSIDGQTTWQTSGMINPGVTVYLRTRTHKTWAQGIDVTVQLGTYSTVWNVTTRAAATAPVFKYLSTLGVRVFPAKAQQDLSADVWSQAVTVYGFDGPLALTFQSRTAGNAEMRVNGGAWATSGSIRPNDVLELRLTSAAAYNTAYTPTVTAGTTSFTWTVTTTTPTPVWVTDADLGARPTGEVLSSLAVVATTDNSSFPVSSYTRSTGTLPTGVAFNSNGTLTGTPTSSGTYNFTVYATNSAGKQGPTRQFTLRINAKPVWQTAADLPSLKVNEPAPSSAKIVATDADGTVTYSVLSGSFPTGLSLDPNSGAFVGTPTASAYYSFTARATDNTGLTDDRTFNVWVYGGDRAPATFTASQTPPGNIWVVGDKILFAYTGGLQAFSSRNVVQARVSLWGAQGGCNGTGGSYTGCSSTQGGSGGYVNGIVAIQPNTAYNMAIGQHGQNSTGGIDGSGSNIYAGGYNGGGMGAGTAGPGGGGRSDFRLGSTATAEVMVAGGGGGGIYNNAINQGGESEAGGLTSTRVTGQNGVAGAWGSYKRDTGGGGGGYYGGGSQDGDDVRNGYGGSNYTGSATSATSSKGVNREGAGYVFTGTGVTSVGNGYGIIEIAGVQ